MYFAYYMCTGARGKQGEDRSQVMIPAVMVGRIRVAQLTPARWYLLVAGLFMASHAVVDIVFYDQSVSVGHEAVARSHTFVGVFQLNLWHSVAEFASAITYLALACSSRWATLGTAINGLIYAALFASFYIFGSDNLLAHVMVENHVTNSFHLLLALAAFIAIWLTVRQQDVNRVRQPQSG